MLVRKGLQYTFAILKPDVANSSITRESILSIIEANGFQIVRIKKTKMSLELAKEFYSEHQGKFFFNRLVTFMSSSPIYALILAKNDNAICSWRSLIGKANVYKTIYSDPDCLRSKFGLSDTRNAVHGSDSKATVCREVSFFFPDFLIHHDTKKLNGTSSNNINSITNESCDNHVNRLV